MTLTLGAVAVEVRGSHQRIPCQYNGGKWTEVKYIHIKVVIIVSHQNGTTVQICLTSGINLCIARLVGWQPTS